MNIDTLKDVNIGWVFHGFFKWKILFDGRRMKHKKYLRKQVEGDDSENVSDDKEDDEPSLNLKYIKKEDSKLSEDTREDSPMRLAGKK